MKTGTRQQNFLAAGFGLTQALPIVNAVSIHAVVGRYSNFWTAAARSLAWATRAAKRGSPWSDLRSGNLFEARAAYGEVEALRYLRH